MAAVFDDGLLQLGRVNLNILILARRNHANLKLSHLADLLFQRHAREKRFDTPRVFSQGTRRTSGHLEESIAVVNVRDYRSPGSRRGHGALLQAQTKDWDTEYCQCNDCCSHSSQLYP